MPPEYRHTFVATLSTGATVTTSTRTLRYTHAVEVTRHDGAVDIASWHSSEPDATRYANTRRVRNPDRPCRVLPVTRHAYTSPAAAAARDNSTEVGR